GPLVTPRTLITLKRPRLLATAIIALLALAIFTVASPRTTVSSLVLSGLTEVGCMWLVLYAFKRRPGRRMIYAVGFLSAGLVIATAILASSLRGTPGS
ncbi:MAG: hypothetical protein QOI60_1091, partial [Actinomycetota bacterium]|nr:hypothetical protein [Actinomycetota bacterium]